METGNHPSSNLLPFYCSFDTLPPQVHFRCPVPFSSVGHLVNLTCPKVFTQCLVDWSSTRDSPNPLPRKKAMMGEEKGLGLVCVSQGELLPAPLRLFLPISSQGSELHKVPLSGHKQVPPSLSKRDPQSHVPINKRGKYVNIFSGPLSRAEGATAGQGLHTGADDTTGLHELGWSKAGLAKRSNSRPELPLTGPRSLGFLKPLNILRKPMAVLHSDRASFLGLAKIPAFAFGWNYYTTRCRDTGHLVLINIGGKCTWVRWRK